MLGSFQTFPVRYNMLIVLIKVLKIKDAIIIVLLIFLFNEFFFSYLCKRLVSNEGCNEDLSHKTLFIFHINKF